MGIAFLFRNQRAVLDEAERLVHQHLAPGFADIRAQYTKIQIDIAAQCDELLALTNLARETRARRDVAQKVYRAEGQETAEVVTQVDAWIRVLRSAVEYAEIDQHPFATRLRTLYLANLSGASAYRDAGDDLIKVLVAADTEGLMRGLPLPAGFVAQGTALWHELHTNREQASTAEGDRKGLTLVLRFQLAQIARIMQRLEAARRSASIVAGVELPGFDLTLLRSAVAPSPDDDDPLVTDDAADDAITVVPPLTAFPSPLS